MGAVEKSRRKRTRLILVANREMRPFHDDRALPWSFSSSMEAVWEHGVFAYFPNVSGSSSSLLGRRGGMDCEGWQQSALGSLHCDALAGISKSGGDR